MINAHSSSGDLSTSEQLSARQFQSLLNLARGGNTDAFGSLLQWYTGYLSMMAGTQLDRRLRGRVNPSDIVQDAMLAAHRDFGDFRGNTSAELLCWLRRILINTLHHNFDRHIRVGKRDVRREVSVETLATNPDWSSKAKMDVLQSPCKSPSSTLKEAENDNEFAGRLAKLRPDHRAVIVLRIHEGLPFEEIAKRMDRSCGAVRMLWLRALDAYKTLSEDLHGCHQPSE